MKYLLKPFDVAPPFIVKSAQGEIINLNNYHDKIVLLSFFRHAGCPVCNLRMHELIKNYDRLQSQNIEVIAIFESSPPVLRNYMIDSNIPFPVVSDFNLELYKLYRAQKSLLKTVRTLFKKQPKRSVKIGKELYQGKKYKNEGSQTRIPADFLIWKGEVVIAHYGKYIGDHLQLDTFLEDV